MPFSAAAAMVGVPDFGLIHIDAEATARAFQTYLDTASKLTGVSLDDINRTVKVLPVDKKACTLVDLLKCGMKLFDAVVWLTAGRPESHPLVVDPTMKDDDIKGLHEIARAVFFCYFMLLTQARYPVKVIDANAPKIPNFLRVVMGMDSPQNEYVECICSFAPQKFDPKWARYVSFAGFGQEVLSRFGLGVAGERMFAPFALYPCKPDAPQHIKDAYAFAKAVATTPASWNVHPITRDPNVLKVYGNLNKNLGNLALECFTEDDLQNMANNKVIYKYPVKEPNHRNYMQWSLNVPLQRTDPIFPTLT